MKNHDNFTAERQAFIRSVPRETPMQMKARQRIAEMGEKHLCHPANRVQRITAKRPVLG